MDNLSQQTGKAVIKYLDQDTGKILKSAVTTGEIGTVINYDPHTVLQEFQRHGYDLVANTLPSTATYNDGQFDQNYVIILKHGVAKIDVHTPKNTDFPLPPRDSYVQKYSFRVRFASPEDEQLAEDVVQSIVWQRPLKVDRVTGKVISKAEKWEATDHYQDVDVPVINDYFADRQAVAAPTPQLQDQTETVIYHLLGRIVPVASDGKTRLKNTAAPRYKNNPHNPTAALAKQKVPQIANYRSMVETVKPADNLQDDTLIAYKSEIQAAVFTYIDQTTGKQLVADKLTGGPGTPIAYNTDMRVNEYRQQGYELVSDSYKPGVKYDDTTDDPQQFKIVLKHGERIVDTAKELTDLGLDPQKFQKRYTFTVHFIDEDGHKLHNDVAQQQIWQRKVKVDAVTNHPLKSEVAWKKPATDYHSVTVPVIRGYISHTRRVKHPAIIPFNFDQVVVYQRLGRIIPVDAQGKALANAAHPQYANTLHDPAALLANQPVPTVAGYEPLHSSITPIHPLEDTKVEYRQKDK